MPAVSLPAGALSPQEWLAKYKPPITSPNRFVLAATSVLCFSLAVFSAWHVRVPHVPH